MTEFSEEYDGSDPLGENIDIEDWDEIDEIFKVPDCGESTENSGFPESGGISDGISAGIGGGGSPKGGWNTYPYGTPTQNCYKNLVIDVMPGSAAHFDKLLTYACQHIEKRCQCTELVVFRIHKGVTYQKWIARYRTFWHSQFKNHSSVKFAIRVSRTWMPSGSATIDPGGLPNHATGHPFGVRFSGLSAIKRDKIRLRVWLLDCYGHLDDSRNQGCRYIKLYTGQPSLFGDGRHYSGPAFGFGHLGTTIGDWTARIYIDRRGLFHIGFPMHLFRGTPGTVQICGKGSWRPADTASFFLDPLQWI